MNEIALDKVIEWVAKGWRLDELHGLPHWQRVERNGRLLLAPGANLSVVRLFAYLHDACRTDDNEDLLHGARAGTLVDRLRNTLLSELSEVEAHQLKTACALHTATLCVDDPTIDTCFDADRLDLERCGITPDPQRMATARGRYFAAHLDLFHALTRT